MNTHQVKLYAYNPEWVIKFERLKSWLNHAASEFFADVQHIGSTSVPNMPAKDIVDVQCAIKTFSFIPQIQEKLKPLGFTMMEGIKQDHVPFHEMDYFSPEWEKRLFKGAFEGQSYHIHLRLINSANWQFALAFKKHISHHEKAKYAYIQLKERLVDAQVDAYHYCLLKDSFIDLMSLQFDT